MISENFSGGKPSDPQESLKEVDTFIHDKCFSIDNPHLIDITFIALLSNFGYYHLSSLSYSAAQDVTPPRIFSSTDPAIQAHFSRQNSLDSVCILV